MLLMHLISAKRGAKVYYINERYVDRSVFILLRASAEVTRFSSFENLFLNGLILKNAGIKVPKIQTSWFVVLPRWRATQHWMLTPNSLYDKINVHDAIFIV